MTFVANPAMLIVLRFLLGVTEAGFFPGIILYLSFWFPAERRLRPSPGSWSRCPCPPRPAQSCPA
jgi:MFS family permease